MSLLMFLVAQVVKKVLQLLLSTPDPLIFSVCCSRVVAVGLVELCSHDPGVLEVRRLRTIRT
jgi:hypothetical protein